MAKLEPVTVEWSSGPITFNDPAEAKKWLEDQTTKWSWLNLKEMKPVRANTSDLPSIISHRLGSIKAGIEAWQANPSESANLVSQFRNGLQEKVPSTSDPIFKFAETLVAEGKPQVAAAAVATTMGCLRFHSDQPVPAVIFEGLVQATLFSQAIAQASVDANNKSIADARNSITQLISTNTIELARHNAEFENALLIHKRAMIENEAETHNTWNDKIAESIAALNATKLAYTEQMRLQASVHYWGNQSANQKQISNRYMWCLMIYILCAATLAYVAAQKYAPMLLNVPADKAAFAFALTGSAFLVSMTVIFWIGRVLVKLFLSSQHLATDATERVVMIQTFLALINEGKLDPSERTLVLSPLFRPSSDGIVRDDAAPDLSPAGALAKMLDRSKP